MRIWHEFQVALADRMAAALMRRLEEDNALPLPERLYDVVVDDPSMAAMHEYRDVPAVSARAAQIEGYRRAMRAEGWRCVANHAVGDEVTLSVAPDAAIFAKVHLPGQHPAIDYTGAPVQFERLREQVVRRDG